MQQKAFTLHNRGMNRDLSISKAGESSAYENHNIRILARDNDTMLSVTNERGNKEISLGSDIVGTLIGWNVLNNHIILFTHAEDNDRIYRIDYNGSSFKIVYGNKEEVTGSPIYTGDLGFSDKHPIESIVYHETDDIQKIYWIDGEHPLRFMNFMAEKAEVESWNDGDNTHFDSNRPINFTLSASISKDNSGNNRANGTVQYLLTYFNKHGQETGIAWVSDLVYLSPSDTGGSADGQNSNKVTITFSNLDTRFTNFRIYSIFRSSLNGTPVAYIVGEGDTGDSAIIIDDGYHIFTEDVTRLLYLGSQNLKAETMTHKDQTLFLGDLKSTGQDFSSVEAAIDSMFSDKSKGLSGAITFEYSEGNTGDVKDIPYSDIDGTYAYSSQLVYSSSDILSFKGGEKYRFALSFRLKSGASTRAFWIGDAENRLYPIIDTNNRIIKRIVAKCRLTHELVEAISNPELEIASVQLMIAEATYADRSVKAQGILNPTMFNVWERYNSRLYSLPSWITRPRGSNLACNHFSPVNNSTFSSGEIQCNYWETEANPTPYYRVENGEIVDELDGIADYDHVMIVYSYSNRKSVSGHDNDTYNIAGIIIKCKGDIPAIDWTDQMFQEIAYPMYEEHQVAGTNLTSVCFWLGNGNYKYAYTIISKFLRRYGIFDTGLFPLEEDIKNWFNGGGKKSQIRVQGNSSVYATSWVSAMRDNGVWLTVNDGHATSNYSHMASYYKEHLMFVDENVVTLNSPEYEYEAVYTDNKENLNGYKLRIVGVAKITGGYSDYTVDASHGKASGENLISTPFIATNNEGNLDGLTAWPLWKEYGLDKKVDDTVPVQEDVKKRDPGYYRYISDLCKYWLYAWNHIGKIDGFTDDDSNDYSSLHSKVFANMRFSNCTLYKNLSQQTANSVFAPESVRMFTAQTSQYTGINVGNDTKFYDGNPSLSLGLPGNHKYPILLSKGTPDNGDIISASPEEAYLFIDDPVPINFLSSAHAVISLPTEDNINGCTQTVLPSIFAKDSIDIEAGAIIPWMDKSYGVRRMGFSNQFNSRYVLSEADNYVFIGELYYDYSSNDTRYGGVSEAAVEACRFVTAGPSYSINNIADSPILYGNQGDTYIQRWDCLKTKPVGASAPNGVIDITSVMLETHVNIDGRTDKLRGTKYLASIPTEEFGSLNPVYSQQNNYFSQRELDEDANLDSYRSSITWTLDKHDSADIDEWTHITLANSLKLDGDNGWCRALRRFNNSIIAFQDRGISEILFNSRTQLTTTDGVPVEIANSGKVDGKRYITNKYGCTNKWSIVEGKAALYFVDNINKAFCAFGGQGIQSLSSRLGFDAWFRRKNNIEPWTPDKFDNIVAYYDRIHSDVYLITDRLNDDMDCLVYSETLGAFTSFFDYDTVPMLTNVEDKFVSFRDGNLWLQNEGLYCNFFGHQYDFWMNYRVTPDPFGDKIWTNIDYRADYYRLLDDDGTSIVSEGLMINGEFYDEMAGTYQEGETFDSLRIWNEYQNTGDITLGRDYSTDKTTRRKFRIWHVAIPRSQKSDRNKWGLDRIRNPWINLSFRKKADKDNNKDMMQLHDITVRYYE